MEQDDVAQRVYQARLFTALAFLPSFIMLGARLVLLATGRLPWGQAFHPGAMWVASTLLVPGILVLTLWLLGERRQAGALIGAALYLALLVRGLLRHGPDWLTLGMGAVGFVLSMRVWLALHGLRARIPEAAEGR